MTRENLSELVTFKQRLAKCERAFGCCDCKRDRCKGQQAEGSWAEGENGQAAGASVWGRVEDSRWHGWWVCTRCLDLILCTGGSQPRLEAGEHRFWFMLKLSHCFPRDDQYKDTPESKKVLLEAPASNYRTAEGDLD